MKTLITHLLVVTCVCSSLASPTFDNITNLWYTAQHSNVLALANQRLAANTNDIAGVLMKASWDFEFLEPTDISNALARVVQIGSTCQSPAFSNIFEITKIDVRFLMNTLSEIPPEERIADRAKRGLPGKLPHFLEELKALDGDGYFSQNQ